MKAPLRLALTGDLSNRGVSCTAPELPEAVGQARDVDLVHTFSFSSSQGSVAIAGAVVRWLRDNMGIIKSSAEIGSLLIMTRLFCNRSHDLIIPCARRLISETLAATAGTSYGCYFVPAFSGLYAPYWEPSARG